MIQIFLGNVSSRDRRLALRNSLNPSCFSLFGPFSLFMLHFVYGSNNCLLLTLNCLLLPLVDILILMDPNGSPLPKETTTVYVETTSSTLYTVQAPSSEGYGLAVILPTCSGARVPLRQTHSSGPQSMLAQGTS